jgi:hypothetical protein
MSNAADMGDESLFFCEKAKSKNREEGFLLVEKKEMGMPKRCLGGSKMDGLP